MQTSVLRAASDPMGAAISDYYHTGQASRLRVFSSQFEEDEIPVSTLFRKFEQMPALEQRALREAGGRVLDVGAGSGCHSLELMQMGKDVTAIDISPASVEVMLHRGIRARLTNVFDAGLEGVYDTVLLLMNGAGVIGTLSRVPAFCRRMKELLAPGGVILVDSSDLRYLYEEADGSYWVNLAEKYYGEVDFTMQYKQIRGERFEWLYIDFDTLAAAVSACGFKAELLQTGGHYDYLARLSLR